MSVKHHAVAVICASLFSAMGGAGVMTFFSLKLTQVGMWETRGMFNRHVEESHQIHQKMTDFMKRGPRFSKSQGLKQCLAINELQEALIETSESVDIEPIECK